MINYTEAETMRDRLAYVVAVMDERGRSYGTSRMLWQTQWDDIRLVLVTLIAFLDTSLTIGSRQQND